MSLLYFFFHVLIIIRFFVFLILYCLSFFSFLIFLFFSSSSFPSLPLSLFSLFSSLPPLYVLLCSDFSRLSCNAYSSPIHSSSSAFSNHIQYCCPSSDIITNISQLYIVWFFPIFYSHFPQFHIFPRFAFQFFLFSHSHVVF